MIHSVHESTLPVSSNANEGPAYGVLSLEAVRNQHGALVDLRIKWANERVLLTYKWKGTGSFTGCHLSDFLPDKAGQLTEVLTQLDKQGYTSIDIFTDNSPPVQWRLAEFENGYMATLEQVVKEHPRMSTYRSHQPISAACQAAFLQENQDLTMFFALDLELHGITDRNGNFLNVNPAWHRLLGYTEAELLSLNYIELIHPDDRVFALSGSPYLNPDRPALRRQVRIRQKRGTYVRIDWVVDFVDNRQYISGREMDEFGELPDSRRGEESRLSDQPQPIDSNGHYKEQEKVEEALQLSEQRFRAIFNLSYQYIGLMRPDGILLEVNETALRAGGQKLSDVIGKPFWETYWWKISEEEQQKLKDAIEQAARGELVRYEVDVWDATHNRVALDMSIKPIFNDQGQVILLIPEGRDITKKKRAENALRESEQRFREIAENVNDAFWIHATDPFKLVYTNPAFERLVGYSAQALNENPKLLLEAIVEEDRARLIDIFANYRKGEELTGQYRLKEANKMIRWFTIRTVVMKDCQGKPLRYIGVASDITSQKEKEIVLQQSLAREKELNKLKSQFVAIASHEFRTPLATIQSSVDLIGLYLNKEEPMDQPAMRRHLSVIEQEIVAFSNLLTDVLTIGKMEQGKIKFNPRLVDFVALCEDVISTHFDEYRDGRKVRLSVQGMPFTTYLDDKLMRHVLINLLTNAFKFSTDSPELCILFVEKTLIISVKDRGIGIPTEDISSLFQPFFRAGNASSIQGTGLGLAISRQFVELHDGRFTVSSEHNQGTTITVALPVN